MKQIILLGIVIVLLLIGIGFLMRRGNIALFPRIITPSTTPTPNATATPTPTTTNTPTIPPINDNLSLNRNLVDSLKNDNEINLFYKAILNTKLDGLLSTKDSYTVFALNNETMDNLNNKNLAKDKLNTVLKSHVTYGNIDLNKNNNFLSVEGQQTSINGIRILKTIKASNGTIYVIDKALTQ